MHTQIDDVVRSDDPSQSQCGLQRGSAPLWLTDRWYFGAILQAREKAPRHYNVHGKMSSKWQIGRIYFLAYGNFFRILRSGDRLEHTQPYTLTQRYTLYMLMYIDN